MTKGMALECAFKINIQKFTQKWLLANYLGISDGNCFWSWFSAKFISLHFVTKWWADWIHLLYSFCLKGEMECNFLQKILHKCEEAADKKKYLSCEYNT